MGLDDELIQVYQDVEYTLLKRIAAAVEKDNDIADANTWLQRKLLEVRLLRRDMYAQLALLVEADTIAEQIILQTAYDKLNPNTLKTLLASYLGELRNSRFQILRSAEDIYKKIIYQSVQQTALGVTTRLEAAQKALTQFSQRGITAFIDNSGRQWQIETYISMATRTAVSNTARESQVAKAIDNGNDLVIVSSVPNPSPVCQPWERKILSLSGKDSRYPSLDRAKSDGLFHPNCRHRFTIYTPGLTRVETAKEPDNYPAVEQQRYLERQVRKWKRAEATAITDEEKRRTTMKVKEWQSNLRSHVKDNNLVRKRERESITGAR